MSDYTATIGIECHVQLKTKTKLFSAVANDAREAPPNTLISHIDLGMPGALPVLNQAALELAIKASFALNTTPQKFNSFDRKHYFYPDLPSGYQITQFAHPIILGGHVDIEVDGQTKRIDITRAHLEADAGKSTHPTGKDYSLVDLNRAGTPLLEIVSEPDMHSAAEAKVYAHELYLLMKYADVSDANLYYGNMRFDVNVSVSKDPAKMGTRTETKNLNSFRTVEKAVEYEIARQTKELENGNIIIQETRGWDDAKQKTFSQRTKEDSHDYRYFPDPDIPPIVLDDVYINRTKASMPLLPADYRKVLSDLDIDPTTIHNIVSVPDMAVAVKEIADLAGASHARRIAFWLIWKTGIFEEEDGVRPAPVAELIGYERMIKLSKMVDEEKLNSTAAKEVFYDMITNRAEPDVIAQQKNLFQVSDEGAITEIVKKVLADNTKAAEDVKNGEMKAIGFLVGQVMKESKGQANPELAKQLISKELGV